MTRRQHAVQFYENRRFLHDRVQRFFDRALDDDQPCVMIARRATFDAVIGGLAIARGGMSDAISAIRFVDADAALGGFMDGRNTDPSDFEKSLSALWNDLRPNGDGLVRIYGELADLLCAADNHDAALSLEQYGQRLMDERPVSILCAHSLEHFDPDEDVRHLHGICRFHTEVLPGEDRGRTPGLAHSPLAWPVCVIDDDVSIRKSIQRVLALNGLSVHTFASAEEFLAAPDITAGCVVLDLQLPGMSGLELQKTMALSGRMLPVIAMSGSTDARLESEAMLLGARAFLRKPFEAEPLCGQVLRVLLSPTPPIV
jgi:CheY-like chemotaxis protein